MTADQKLSVLESYTNDIDIGEAHREAGEPRRCYAIINIGYILCQGYGKNTDEAIHNLYQDLRHTVQLECNSI